MYIQNNSGFTTKELREVLKVPIMFYLLFVNIFLHCVFIFHHSKKILHFYGKT